MCIKCKKHNISNGNHQLLFSGSDRPGKQYLAPGHLSSPVTSCGVLLALLRMHEVDDKEFSSHSY